MRPSIIISTVLFFLSCTNNHDNGSSSKKHEPKSDTFFQQKIIKTESDKQSEFASCDKTALDFLKLTDKTIRTDFFRQLDSIRNVQYSKNDQDTAIFIDITPKLLDRFIRDLNKDELSKTGEFEKEYNFNIAPPQYRDSKECKDKISIAFDKNTCRFRLTIFNVFFAEWCQESTVIYGFQISSDKILNFGRSEAG